MAPPIVPAPGTCSSIESRYTTNKQGRFDYIRSYAGEWSAAHAECDYTVIVDDIVKLIDDIVKDPALKEASTKAFVRYIQLLIDKKEFDYALRLINALEGHPTGSTPKEMAAKRVAGSLSYIEGILGKEPLNFTKGEYENVRAQVYMGVADVAKKSGNFAKAKEYYEKAIKLYSSAITAGTTKYFDYKPGAKKSLVSCKIGLAESKTSLGEPPASILAEIKTIDLSGAEPKDLPLFKERIILTLANLLVQLR